MNLDRFHVQCTISAPTSTDRAEQEQETLVTAIQKTTNHTSWPHPVCSFLTFSALPTYIRCVVPNGGEWVLAEPEASGNERRSRRPCNVNGVTNSATTRTNVKMSDHIKVGCPDRRNSKLGLGRLLRHSHRVTSPPLRTIRCSLAVIALKPQPSQPQI